MNVLVTAASKEGSTAEIAEAIADVLSEKGLDAIVIEPERVDDIGGHDAFVIGSAVYAGHWLQPAIQLVDRIEPMLAGRPVWLFSSGPVGNPSRKLVRKMGADPVDLPSLRAQTNARAHRMLAGKLIGHNGGFAQRVSLRFFRGFEGDWRDWDAIERWATAIADELMEGGEAAS
jgi:menaquinone-dependent protoporphyrinogen oxidase